MIVAPHWVITDYYLAKAAGRPWYDPVMAQVIVPQRAHPSKMSQIGAMVLISNMSLAVPLFEIWQYDVTLGMLDEYGDDFDLERTVLSARLWHAMAEVKELQDASAVEYFKTAIMVRTNRAAGKYQPPLRSSDHPEIKRVWSELAIACPEVAGNLSEVSGGKRQLNRQDLSQARKDIEALGFVTRPGASLNFINAMVDAFAPTMFVRARDGTLTLRTQHSLNDNRHPQPISGTALAA